MPCASRLLRAGLLAGCLAAWAQAAPANATDDSDQYLAFESVGDGRCQILSDGGKLRILRNLHPERAIRYRLLRLFAGGHPQGLTAGTAPAGGEPVPLGCTLVDGRVQDWQLVKAHFE